MQEKWLQMSGKFLIVGKLRDLQFLFLTVDLKARTANFSKKLNQKAP